MRTSRLPMFWQIFLPNAAVLIAAGLILALSPATVSAPIQLREAAVLILCLGVMVVLNLVLIRRATSPLERLAKRMADFDPMSAAEPPRKIERASQEIDQLADAFGEMAERLRRARRESSQYMLYGQEEERHRLAMELHDEIGQSLTALMLVVDSAVDSADGTHREQLVELREMARRLSHELHRIVVRLRPEALDDLGLRSALVALTERFSGHGVTIRREISLDAEALDPEVELVIYRVSQEALTNAARHSGASEVVFSVTGARGAANLRVADDGRGLNGAIEGAGIQGMRERAMLIDADFELTSSSSGTQVVLRVPARGAG